MSPCYDPFDQWNRMDNYFKDFFLQNSGLDCKIKHKIKRFLFQYLTKVANIDRRDAARWGRDISPWRSQGRNDYHRDYRNDNPLLKIVEFEILRIMGLNRREILLLNDQELPEEYKKYEGVCR